MTHDRPEARRMELARLVEALSDPAAYPHPVDRVAVIHTHISVVFLAGAFAYKLKKPVDFGFLDFTTIDKRRHFCHEEVRLNRRLAPSVYLGVEPVVQTPAGLRIGAGEAIDWVVKMERLPAGTSLLDRLARGEVTPELVARLAEVVAEFHARAGAGPHVSQFGRFDVVAANARDNFAQSESCVGRALSRPVFDRLRTLTDAALERLQRLIESRAARGVPRDTHGDLHLDHVYHFPDRPPPADLVAIDCVEFSERFRCADPVADAAFLVMDLIFRGRRDLADVFADAYFSAANDAEGRRLLPFYVAYRAAIRGKVEGLELGEKEIPQDERSDALRRARGHWLLALTELADPAGRPALVLVGGLPGTGKSTLAGGLAERGGFTLIRSDVVRKELAGLAPGTRAGAEYYTPEWTDRTYAECLGRAESLLFAGERVIVDATFGEERHRRALLDAAARLCVPAVFLVCTASPGVARRRIANRRGDASDADAAVYEQASARWEGAGPLTHGILTDGTADDSLAAALEALRRARLWA